MGLEDEGYRIMAGTNPGTSSTASMEGALDDSGPIGGETIVSLSAALRRHLWLGERAGRAVGGVRWSSYGRRKAIADADE